MSNKEYYYGIDLIKLVCAFLVVSIHTTLFMDMNQQLFDIYGNYITRFAVPFFFISSGFFFAKPILYKDDKKEIRSNIKKYFFRLLRPFVIWGMCYFALAVAEEIVIEKKFAKNVLIEKLHLLVVESPGGGLWYVYAVLWIVLILFCFYKKNSEYVFYGVSFVLFLVPGIWSSFAGQQNIIGWLYKGYYSVFMSERSFWFYAVYFFSGIMLFRFKPKKHPVWLYLLLQAGLYTLYVFINVLPNNVVTGLLTQISKYAIAIVWFLIALNIPNECIAKGWLRDNARLLSTIIYFTHFISIYTVKLGFRIIGIKFNDYCSPAYICCMIILIIYGVAIIQMDKKKTIIRKLY